MVLQQYLTKKGHRHHISESKVLLLQDPAEDDQKTPIGYALGMFPEFGITVGTEEYEFTSTDMFANVGIRLTGLRVEM